jgi:hypothetical protein
MLSEDKIREVLITYRKFKKQVSWNNSTAMVNALECLNKEWELATEESVSDWMGEND